MADQSTYIGVDSPRTIKTTTALGRGLRVTRGANGECTLAGILTRGDYVLLQDSEAGKLAAAASMSAAAKVPAVASEAVAVGDIAYSAANGKTSKTAAGAVQVGKWVVAASGDGVLGEVELLTPTLA